MPPKKRFKIDEKQKPLSQFFHKTAELSVESTQAEPEQTVPSTVQAEIAEISPADADTSSSTEQCSASISGPKFQRKFQSRWKTMWPWVIEKDDKMFCKNCIDKGKSNTFTTGCTTMKTSSLIRHEKTDDHASALQAVDLQVDIKQAARNLNSAEDEGVLKAIRVVLWLASENLPLTKYESMMDLVKTLGVDVSILNISKRVNYDSYYTANEILGAISDSCDQEVTDKLSKSPFISILADESTDRANKKRMTLNARVCNPDNSEPETLFLRDIEYEDGTGVGLSSVILQELQRRKIPIEKVAGFGSDGAAVMTGGNKGVRGILMRKNPHLIHVHCMAHRLALCTSQAADAIPPIKSYQNWLTSLFYYFAASGTREKELHSVQEILQHPVLKYKEIHAVRWLSCFEAVEAVYRTLDPLITYLHQRTAAKDPKSKGLLKTMSTTEFIYLLMDVLPLVSKLCLTFQSKDLDVAKAKVSIDACIADLEAYKDGTQLFPTHLEKYPEDVSVQDGKPEFRGHILTNKGSNLAAIKSRFVNQVLSNIRKRFPQKTLLDAFFILGMRSINVEPDPAGLGKDELETLLTHFGEEQTYMGTVAVPVLQKDVV